MYIVTGHPKFHLRRFHAFKKFKYWRLIMLNQTRKMVKLLRTHNNI